MTLSYSCAEIRISFERSKYEVRETDGRQDNLISLITENNIVTERNLDVILQLSPPVGEADAIISK